MTGGGERGEGGGSTRAGRVGFLVAKEGESKWDGYALLLAVDCERGARQRERRSVGRWVGGSESNGKRGGHGEEGGRGAGTPLDTKA